MKRDIKAELKLVEEDRNKWASSAPEFNHQDYDNGVIKASRTGWINGTHTFHDIDGNVVESEKPYSFIPRMWIESYWKDEEEEGIVVEMDAKSAESLAIWLLETAMAIRKWEKDEAILD